MAQKEAFYAYLFLAPWIVGFLVFVAGPIIASLLLSFTKYNIANPPSFGVGTEWMLRSLGTSIALMRRAIRSVAGTSTHARAAAARNA